MSQAVADQMLGTIVLEGIARLRMTAEFQYGPGRSDKDVSLEETLGVPTRELYMFHERDHKHARVFIGAMDADVVLVTRARTPHHDSYTIDIEVHCADRPELVANIHDRFERVGYEMKPAK